MKILIIGNGESRSSITSFNKKHIEKIKQIDQKLKVSLIDNEKQINKYLRDAEVIIFSSHLSHLNLNGSPNLKWIHLTSAGVNNALDLTSGRNIIITNSSGVHPIPISEHVFAYLLMFSRQIHRSYRAQIEDKKWIRDLDVLKVFELYGKTLGIVGWGRIGARIALNAKSFGMKVLALSHREKIRDQNVDEIFKDVNMILKKSDFIVNCLPETSETNGYFDSKKFKQMRIGSYFVNIGRGKTVVEKDLIDVLRRGPIAGAGLDVFELEPLPITSPLWDLKNVIITPHYAGWTPKYADRVIEIFCENLKAYLKRKPMPNLIDKTKGY